MKAALDHTELQDLLPAAALESLDNGELQLVLAHSKNCVECARLLEEYREVVASLTLQLPKVQPWGPTRSGLLRARLLQRVRADKRSRAVGGQSFRADRWIGWMVAAGLAGVLLVHHSVHRPVDYGWLAAGVFAIVLVALGIYARIQRGRVSALRDRLTELERKK